MGLSSRGEALQNFCCFDCIWEYSNWSIQHCAYYPPGFLFDTFVMTKCLIFRKSNGRLDNALEAKDPRTVCWQQRKTICGRCWDWCHATRTIWGLMKWTSHGTTRLAPAAWEHVTVRSPGRCRGPARFCRQATCTCKPVCRNASPEI